MRDTRLIFIDGIPGSGKSTTAHRLHLHLQACRWDVTWFYEHDITHPIYRREEKKRFCEEGFLDVDRLQPQIVSRWQAFAAVGWESPATTIMDGAFFQLPLGFMMLMNVGEAALERHVRQVAAAVEPLAPVLIYFYQEDIRKSLAAVCELRRDASFAEQLIKFIASTLYGKSHRVQDLQGVADHYQDMRDKVLVLLDDLRMPKLTIESSAGDWQQYERQITEFLHLPQLATVYPLPEDTGRLAGRYRASGTGEELEVTGPSGRRLPERAASHAVDSETGPGVLPRSDLRGGWFRVGRRRRRKTTGLGRQSGVPGTRVDKSRET